jgi:hypothetical protein
MPGDFRCDRDDYARVFVFITHEAAGASSARHSLRPLLLRAAKQFMHHSGAPRREIAESYFAFDVIASEAKQSTAGAMVTIDCFVVEPVIGRVFARPVGSQ